MKFLSFLALAAAATAAVMPNAASPDAADPMAFNEQAAPQADADAVNMAAGNAQPNAQPQGWYPPPPPPPPPVRECRPGTYSCTTTNNGFRVCDYSGHWVFGGYCGRRQHCQMNWQNQSPYCVPNY